VRKVTEKKYLVGEVAKACGLTIRTLQHYDNIGLLPSSGRTEGGRRYYTSEDMLRLSQIVFYRSIGIPLSDIRDRLPDHPGIESVESIFKEQLAAILEKIGSLSFMASAIESSLEVIKAGKMPQWEILAELIRITDGSNIVHWADLNFAGQIGLQTDSDITSLSGALNYYNNMRSLIVRAITLKEIGVTPESEKGQAFGKQWWEDVVLSVTDGVRDNVSAIAEIGKNRDNWPYSDRTLFELAEPYIEAALVAYVTTNGIELPKNIFEEGLE
jgi:DNA-binding transcriptional MerR regulator